MPKITFLPRQVTVDIPEGAPLLEAARLAGVPAETPCGGHGRCGKCLVRVLSGGVDARGYTGADGEVLLCQTNVRDEPVTVRLTSDLNAERGQFDRETGLARLDSEALSPLVEALSLTVAPPVFGDGLADLDRFEQAVSAAVPGHRVHTPSAVLAALPVALRKNGGAAEILYRAAGGELFVVGLNPLGRYGVAVDIGTTTVALWLVDLSDGRVLAAQTAYNAQIACGLDVISRINYARKYLPELTDRILDTVGRLLDAAAGPLALDRRRIVCACVAGNTTMIHLLLGIVPEYIRLEPYVPAVFSAPVFRAGEIGLPIAPDAPVLIAPAVGSYVGGDITAGALCTSLAGLGAETVLFLDIGTNGEILLGNGEFILACACSAGPAFEGGGIRHGMRASQGAIDRVSIDPVTGTANCRTIGDAPPIGICGSGMLSLTAELFRRGLIDSAGKFADTAPLGLERGYALGGRVTVSETDLNNLIRAKGAIFSACRTLLASVGLGFEELDRVYIAGGFGSYLDLADAKTIGLLPNLPDERFCFLGNAAVAGAYLTLLSQEYRDKLKTLAGRITYLDLSNEPGYIHEYMAALFLPHTDETLFG